METGILRPLNKISARSDLSYDSIFHFTSLLSLIKVYGFRVGRHFWGTGSNKENCILVLFECYSLSLMSWFIELL